MKVIPIGTRFARHVDAYEKALAKAIPDGEERAQAIADLQAFLKVAVLPDEGPAEWADKDLDLFRDEFIAQSGKKRGEGRFFNLLIILDRRWMPDEERLRLHYLL